VAGFHNHAALYPNDSINNGKEIYVSYLLVFFPYLNIDFVIHGVKIYQISVTTIAFLDKMPDLCY